MELRAPSHSTRLDLLSWYMKGAYYRQASASESSCQTKCPGMASTVTFIATLGFGSSVKKFRSENEFVYPIIWPPLMLTHADTHVDELLRYSRPMLACRTIKYYSVACAMAFTELLRVRCHLQVFRSLYILLHPTTYTALTSTPTLIGCRLEQ